jgi:splicing factor 4
MRPMLANLVAGDHIAPLSDPVALMEFYAKKTAQEEWKRPPRQSKDEMPPPSSLQGTSTKLFSLLKECRNFNVYSTPKKGHQYTTWVTSFLQKNLKCLWHTVQKATKEAAEKAKIQADNAGHKLV